MKNLETMPEQEMRTMLKNINEILETFYPGLTADEQNQQHIELICMEFFEEGPTVEPKSLII